MAPYANFSFERREKASTLHLSVLGCCWALAFWSSWCNAHCIWLSFVVVGYKVRVKDISAHQRRGKKEHQSHDKINLPTKVVGATNVALWKVQCVVPGYVSSDSGVHAPNSRCHAHDAKHLVCWTVQERVRLESRYLQQRPCETNKLDERPRPRHNVAFICKHGAKVLPVKRHVTRNLPSAPCLARVLVDVRVMHHSFFITCKPRRRVADEGGLINGVEVAIGA